MVRGRASARGTRRGAATAGQRLQTESNDAGSSQTAATSGKSVESSESTQPASRGTPGAAVRGTSATRATRGPTTARFRPKVIRRDEAERENLARQEEKKANERAADEKRARGRTRFRSKRSRGDAMGSRGGFGRPIAGASGPFSSGIANSSGGGWFGGGGSGGSGGFGGRGFSRGSKSESKSGFATADGSRYREARINADKLNVNTPDEEFDSEDEAMMAALGSKTSSVLPMGIYRTEHKDEGVIVATTAELEAAEKANGEEESLWVDGDGSEPPALPDQPEEGGVWGTNGKKADAIKKEPDNDDSMPLDDAKSPAAGLATESPAVETKPKKATPQDTEEKMIQSDLEMLASELGAVAVEEGEEGKSEAPSNKDGRMYLFQFPPLLPPLKTIAEPKMSRNKVKPEPEDANMVDATPVAPETTPVDLTGEEAEDEEEPDEDPEETAGFMSQLLSQGGLVGKLKVRKSGRVELDWGGRVLEMSPAAGMNFLSTAVIVEENDEKPRPGVIGGESIGMGKIMGRFVLAPTWEEEEDWVVSPEELRTE